MHGETIKLVVLIFSSAANASPKNLILITASCLDACCVLTARNVLYKFDNTQRDAPPLSLSQKKKYILVSCNQQQQQQRQQYG